MSELDELIQAYLDCIRRNEEIVKKMEKIVEEVESFKSNCMVAKTVGTTMEVVGAAGLALAPFTGGTSLAISVGVGIVGAAAGLGTNLITDWIDSSETKEFIEALTDYNEFREAKLAHLAELLNSLTSCVQKYLKNEQVVDDASFYGGIYKMDGGKTGWFHQFKFRRSVNKLQKMESSHQESLNTTGGLGNIKAVAIASVAAYFVTNAALLAASQGSKSTLLGIQAMLKSAATYATATTVLQAVAMIGAAVFITIEISRLISEWTSEHPACTYAKDLIQNIKDQTESFTTMVEILIRSREVLRVPKQLQKKRTDDECTCVPIKIPVLYLNIQSMRPINMNRAKTEKIKKFKNLVSQKNPQIIALVETWLEPKDTTEDVQNLFGLGGYTIHRVDRKAEEGVPDSQEERRKKSKKRRGGGMLVAWKSVGTDVLGVRVSPHTGSELNQHDSLQSYTVERIFRCRKCNSGKSEKKLSFRVLYRRPARHHHTQEDSSEDKKDYEEKDTNLLERLFNFFKDDGGFESYDGSVVVGDFNMEPKKLKEKVDTFPELWNIKLREKTRFSGLLSSSPDAIIATPQMLVTDPVGHTRGISDHAALDFNINFGKDYIQFCDVCD